MLMVVSSLETGSMLMAIVVGEYLWRVLDEVRGAPSLIEARQDPVPPTDAPAGEQL